MPLSGIGVETLFDWCGADDFDVIDELIKKSWVIHNPATDEVHLHPLVADLCQEQLAADPDCCNKFLETMIDTIGYSFNTEYEMKLRLLDMAEAAFARLPADHPMRRKVLLARAQASKNLSLFEISISLYQELLATAQDLYDKLFAYNQIAHSKMMLGYPEACRDIAQEGYSLIRDIPTDELTPEIGGICVSLLWRLTESSRDLGDYQTSIEYGRQSVLLAERFPRSPWQHYLGWAEYHLSRSLYMNGDLDESEQHMDRAVSLFSEIDDKWSICSCNDALGQIQMKRGHFEQALALNQQAQDVLVSKEGSESSGFAGNLVMRGDICRAMGDEERAKGCYTQAAAIYRKLNLTRLEQRTLALLRGEQG